MESAIIVMVIDDADGASVVELVEAKTKTAFLTKLKKRLKSVVKDYHEDNDNLEKESDQYINDVVEDLLDEDQENIYVPSCYQGSGFVQVEYL